MPDAKPVNTQINRRLFSNDSRQFIGSAGTGNAQTTHRGLNRLDTVNLIVHYGQRKPRQAFSSDFYLRHRLMRPNTPYQFATPPLAIGGVGGSGTRLITEILQDLDFFMGSDLNGPRDNIAFSFLLKRAELWPLADHEEEVEEALDIFFNAMYFHQPLSHRQSEFITKLGSIGRPPHNTQWPRDRADKLLADSDGESIREHWGWKEPNTHIFLPLLVNHVPDIKYIHVVRHGLDMAFSDNQSQAQLWGQALTGRQLDATNPTDAFTYWCASHERVISIGKKMGPRFFLLNYDNFCQQPEEEFERLVDFLAITVSESKKLAAIESVKPPSSIGRRHAQQRLSINRDQRRLLTEMGFET